jgi:hypothetical protein
MKKILTISTLLMFLLILNCAMAGYGPNGLLLTNTKIGSYGTGKGGGKTGEACATSILGIVAFGDGSIEAAKNQGGINDITSVSHEQFSILGLYAKLCTIVKGN